MISIDKLLKKKTWRGAEVGRLHIASLMIDIQNAVDKENKPQILTASDVDMMVNNLTEAEYRVYMVYKSLYSALLGSYSTMGAFYQQFLHGSYRVCSYLEKLIALGEDMLEHEFLAPLKMSVEQYGRIVEESKASNKNTCASYCSLVFQLKSSFMYCDGKAKLPKAVADAIKALKAEPATPSLRHYEEYMATAGSKDFELKDGTRKSQLSETEWRDKLSALLPTKTKMKALSLVFKGPDRARAFLQDRTGKALTCSDEELIADLEAIGAGEKGVAVCDILTLADKEYPFIDVHEAGRAFLEAVGADMPEAAYRSVYTPPENPSVLDVAAFYADDEVDSEASAQEALQAFREDVPALCEAIENYIVRKLPEAKAVQHERCGEAMWTWGELASRGVFGFDKAIEVHQYDLIENYRKLYDKNGSNNAGKIINGITLCFGNKNEKCSMDYKYHFISYDINEDTGKNIKSFREFLFDDSIKNIFAFNCLIDILSSVYKIPEIGFMKMYEDSIDAEVRRYNQSLLCAYQAIAGTAEEIEQKKETIRRYFSFIDLDTMRPTQDAIDGVTRDLSRLGEGKDAARAVFSLLTWWQRLIPQVEA